MHFLCVTQRMHQCRKAIAESLRRRPKFAPVIACTKDFSPSVSDHNLSGSILSLSLNSCQCALEFKIPNLDTDLQYTYLRLGHTTLGGQVRSLSSSSKKHSCHRSLPKCSLYDSHSLFSLTVLPAAKFQHLTSFKHAFCRQRTKARIAAATHGRNQI